MAEDMQFDYYYGSQAEQFSFFRLPKVLIKDKRFKKISSDAKILYGIMLDRMSLSIKNRWVDKENRVYIIFTLEEVMREFECSERKASYLMAELDTKAGIGLIEKKRQGLGRPNLIYLKNFIVPKDYSALEEGKGAEQAQGEVLQFQTGKNMQDSSGTALQAQNCKKVQPKEGKTLQEQTGTLLPVQSGINLQVQTGKEEHPCGCMDLPGNKTEINDTDLSNTDKSKNNSIYPIYPSEEKDCDQMKMIDTYTQIVKDNIEYDFLMNTLSLSDKEFVNEIVGLMVEVMCVKREYIRIAGADYPYQMVRNRFLKLDSGHIQYVLECFRNNATKVYNIKAYILTSLFNAPATIDSYYRAEVKHDFYDVK